MNTAMNLQRIPVAQLKPAKYNPRKDLKPGDPAYEKIRRSPEHLRVCRSGDLERGHWEYRRWSPAFQGTGRRGRDGDRLCGGAYRKPAG